MSTLKKHFVLSESEYLEGERISDVKHELIDGQAYAMAGASRNHDRITKNIAREFGRAVMEDIWCTLLGLLSYFYSTKN